MLKSGEYLIKVECSTDVHGFYIGKLSVSIRNGTYFNNGRVWQKKYRQFNSVMRAIDKLLNEGHEQVVLFVPHYHAIVFHARKLFNGGVENV